MFRFSYKSIAVSLSLILIAGFLALATPHLNKQRRANEGLASYLTALAHQTRGDYAHSKDFSLLKEVVFDYTDKNTTRRITLLGFEDGFRFRLVRLPDEVCAFLLSYWKGAQASVIESEDENINWRQSGSGTCYGTPNKKLNALELTFRR